MKKPFFLLLAAMALSACQTSNLATNAVIPQTSSTWDSQYGGADKTYDANLLKLREEIAPKFQVFEFTDTQTGTKIAYNLYTRKISSRISTILWSCSLPMQALQA